MDQLGFIQSKVQHLETEVTQVKGKVDRISTTVSSMNDKMGKMIILLSGNEFDESDGGMIGEHNEMRKKIERLEKFKDKMIYVLIGVGAVGGLNLWQLADAIIKAFKG